MIAKLIRTAMGAALILAAAAAHSDTWPSKPVRWIVGYAAGGGTDALARVVGESVGLELGQPFIVENRPGAATMIAADALAKAAPDGYTIMSADNSTLVNNAAIYKKLTYDPIKDLVPVTLIGRFPLVLVLNPALGIKDFAQLRAAVAAEPAKFHYASSGTGTPFHVGMEFVKQQFNLSIDHIPYKGMAPAMQDVIGGQVEMVLVDVATALPYIRTGKLIPVATASAVRNPQLPEIPSFIELGLKEGEIYGWQGVVVPARTPADIRLKLGDTLRKAVASEKVSAKMRELGIEPITSSADEMAAYIQSESKRWHKLIKDRGITAE